jgi:hypothetical protein
LTALKVEKAIALEHVPKVDAIRIFAGRTGLEIDSTTERGHRPALLIKKIRRESTGKVEIEIVMMGDYHVEPLTYYKKDPETWPSFADIILTPLQSRELAEKILRLLKAPAREPAQTQLLSVKHWSVRLYDVKNVITATRSNSRPRSRRRRRGS